MASSDPLVHGALNAIQAFIPPPADNTALLIISTGIAQFAPVRSMSSCAASEVVNLEMF